LQYRWIDKVLQKYKINKNKLNKNRFDWLNKKDLQYRWIDKVLQKCKINKNKLNKKRFDWFREREGIGWSVCGKRLLRVYRMEIGC